ncbi:hypothetical protein R3W88_020530 [Solanum pinnatisectum]|uniref:Uncharacterized protein n=1 Tax=Solanum pinnatisectum TaxID=50273 RepID=A0AAV9KMX4_9SOLN|nr:hypothetical protein R3W88_020530 [Solanum pinnatisectum]
MSSLRAQNFQRVLIQKVNARIRLAQVCRVILITPSFRFQRIAIARALLKNLPVCPLTFTMYALRYSSVGDLSIFFFFVNAGLNLNYIGDSPGRFCREDKSGNLGEPDSSPRMNLRAVNAKDIGVKIDGKENRAGNGKNPTKGRVRNKTKKIFKHTGKSVGGGIKKVMSGKSPGKSKEELESSETERLSSVESDSSDAESQPSSVDSPPVDNSSTASSGIENSDTTVRTSELVDSESIKTPDEVAAGDSNEHHALGQSSSFKK